MAEKKRGCPECGSPTMHKLTCSRRPGGPNHKKLEREPKAEKVERPAPARVSARLVRATAQFCDPTTLSVEQLVSTIEACQDELRSRKDQVAEQLAAIEKAIGSAAA